MVKEWCGTNWIVPFRRLLLDPSFHFLQTSIPNASYLSKLELKLGIEHRRVHDINITPWHTNVFLNRTLEAQAIRSKVINGATGN